MGVISGSLPLLSLYFNLTTSEEDWIVSLLYFGGGVGAATGGFICDWLGRKFAILITDVSGCVIRSSSGYAIHFFLSRHQIIHLVM
jgi:MFS family permease